MERDPISAQLRELSDRMERAISLGITAPKWLMCFSVMAQTAQIAGDDRLTESFLSMAKRLFDGSDPL
jgi:hypothetical protein